MNKNTINKLVREQKSLLGKLIWEKRIAQDKMSDPKTLNTLEKKINVKKEEIETLEDISDFAKDTGSYNEGYKSNLIKFMNTPNLSADKLNTLRRLKMKLDEEYQQEDLGQASSSSVGTAESVSQIPNNTVATEKKEDKPDKSDAETGSDSSFLDDIF